MKFADLTPGLILYAGPMTVTTDTIVAFANDWDPQPIHTDANAHLDPHNPFCGLIASGWHTAGMAMRLMVEHILQDSDHYCSPGVESLNWPAPTRPGDVLTLKVEVLSQTVSTSGLGKIRWRWQMHNQDDQCALELVATNLFRI